MQFLLFLILLLLPNCLAAQNTTLQQDLNQATLLLKKHHYKGEPILPQTPEFLIQVAANLDDSNLLFNKNDLSFLIQKYPDISKTILTESDAFLTDWLAVTDKALERSEQFIQTFYNASVSIKTLADVEALPHYSDSAIQENEKDQQSAVVYNETLHIVQSWLTVNSHVTIDKQTNISQYVASYVQKFKKERARQILFLQNNKLKWVSKAIKKTYMLYADPHTNWLSSEEFKSFISALSQDEKTFGLTCTENKNNKLIIDKVNPASKAAILNELKSGDIIETIETENSRLDFPTLYDWYSIQWEEGIEKVKLFITTEQNTHHVVEIERQTLENTDNIVRGFILNGLAPIGYIGIPSFFTSWESETTNKTLSNVLAKEIIKLKTSGIKGLILDFRNNGGGSVKEAHELLSMFTDSGPMFQYRVKTESNTIQQKIANDFVRGRVFNLPLVLLINENSASAAEIVAASLQAQGAALLVGNRTYGKGTFQGIYPLYDNPANTEYITITEGVIFTNKGTTHQGTGVTPDIILPTLFESDITREENLPHWISAEPIKALPEKTPRFILPENFVHIVPEFEQKVKHINTLYQTDSTREVEEMKKIQTISSAIRKLYAANLIGPMSVQPNAQDNDLMHSNNAYAQAVKKQEKNISNDPYIQQTYLIINQLIPIWK